MRREDSDVRIAVDDAQLNIVTAGSGDAIVLLHGFPFTHKLWENQIGALARRHFVIAPDLRGAGDSSVTPGPYLMEMLAGDVAAVLDELGVANACIVGHSLGGYIALAFFRMFAERVSKLALVCTTFESDSTPRAQERYELAESAENQGMTAVIDAYLPKLLAAECDAGVREKAMSIMMHNDPKGAAEMLRGMAQRVASDDLIEELKIPVLLVAGGRDLLAPVAQARAVAHQLPSGALAVCERSAHLPMLEEAEVLAAILREFTAP